MPEASWPPRNRQDELHSGHVKAERISITLSLLMYQTLIHVITDGSVCKYGNDDINLCANWQMIIHARLNTNPFEALSC